MATEKIDDKATIGDIVAGLAIDLNQADTKQRGRI